MGKTNKVAEFVKDHKKEIVIAAIAGAVGAICGLAGHKWYVSKSYGSLIESMRPYGPGRGGVSIDKDIERFLNSTTKCIDAMFVKDGAKLTIGDILTPFAIKELVTQGADLDSSSITSGLLVGTMKQ